MHPAVLVKVRRNAAELSCGTRHFDVFDFRHLQLAELLRSATASHVLHVKYKENSNHLKIPVPD